MMFCNFMFYFTVVKLKVNLGLCSRLVTLVIMC